MYVTLRMPASAARQLNLAVDDEQEEVTVALTPMELAGRLTVATGNVFTPESVTQYCRAWAAARAACQGLIYRYGLAGLIGRLGRSCHERLLWLPDDDQGAVSWLRLILEAAVLQSEYGPNLTPLRAYVWAYQLDGQRLAELCEALHPIAYEWWLAMQDGDLSEQ